MPYRGRFAPSPTGALHFGSLVAAVGSYLDAKHHQGQWLVRIEDLDTPRNVAGAAADILRTLESYGLYWDEAVAYQSQRIPLYEAALEQLKAQQVCYPCGCSRKTIAAQQGELVYAGTCRNGILSPTNKPAAWRLRVSDTPIRFTDRLQGDISQHLATKVGDFVIKRADGVFAYQLAVVVDDAAQGINHIVRGADLLDSTPRQIFLQQRLGLPTPCYLHLPLVVNAQGEKLSKQTLAQAISQQHPVTTLYDALCFLQQHPPMELQHGDLTDLWDWAIAHWQPHAITHPA
jgi:glutamyl-Q tRNA(Asp) synthetase